MGIVAAAMEAKLKAALSPLRLELRDQSSLHAGHVGAGVESHFDLIVESEVFAGVGRLARQRLVMGILSEELAGPVHALSIRALAPGEG